MPGTLTLAELQAEIKQALGNRDDQDSRIITALNISQMRIARMRKWEELEALYTQTPTYQSDLSQDKFLAFPTNVRDVYSIRVIDGIESRKLTRVTNRRFDTKVPNSEALTIGRPHMYTLHRNIAELYRIPNKAYEYQVRAADWPTAFVATSSGSVSDLDQKDDMLIALSTSWVFMQLGNEDSANKWWRIYSNMLAAAILEDAEKPDLDISPSAGGDSTGAYYADPWVRSAP